MTSTISNFIKIWYLFFLMPFFSYGGTVLLQSTTSTRNSGIYDALLPEFEASTNILVKVVAVGTGQAIRNAKNCDGDLLIVHSKVAETAFVKSGFGIERFDLMYNDFIIIGPKSDPANLKTSTNIKDIFYKVSSGKHTFVSRGDDSGTHKKELQLWQKSFINPKPGSGSWYLEVGAGMGTALNIAAEVNGYILTDRASWLSFKNKQDLSILYEKDKNLFNQYGIIVVDPEKCIKNNYREATILSEWLRSRKGQASIKDYKLSGVQLFYPNATN